MKDLRIGATSLNCQTLHKLRSNFTLLHTKFEPGISHDSLCLLGTKPRAVAVIQTSPANKAGSIVCLVYVKETAKTCSKCRTNALNLTHPDAYRIIQRVSIQDFLTASFECVIHTTQPVIRRSASVRLVRTLLYSTNLIIYNDTLLLSLIEAIDIHAHGGTIDTLNSKLVLNVLANLLSNDKLTGKLVSIITVIGPRISRNRRIVKYVNLIDYRRTTYSRIRLTDNDVLLHRLRYLLYRFYQRLLDIVSNIVHQRQLTAFLYYPLLSLLVFHHVGHHSLNRFITAENLFRGSDTETKAFLQFLDCNTLLGAAFSKLAYHLHNGFILHSPFLKCM